MPTYRLLIEYEGTRFSGWQSQSNTPKTIQGHLLRVCREMFGKVDIGGAGRTDSGVHACGQIAHLRIPSEVRPRELTRKINDLLPHDITVLDARPVNDKFHARHDAESRIYLYQISRRRTAFAKPFVWWIKDELDLVSMQRAASVLPGMHDFSTFTDRRIETESTRVLVEFFDIGEAGDLILLRIGASHFLWKMVRKLVAALVEVGRGTLKPDEFHAMVEQPGPRFEPTAPPSGLFLEAITYKGEPFDRPLEPVVPVPTVSRRRK